MKKNIVRLELSGPWLFSLTLYIAIALLCPLAVGLHNKLLAQVLKPRSGMYQSTDGLLSAIVSQNEGQQGIFFFLADEPIGIQEYNPAKLSLDSGKHVFIQFNPSLDSPYHAIRIGQNSYNVNGNLTLWLDRAGDTRIDIDNSNPYLTLIHSDPTDKTETIVGFYGITEVIRGTGEMSAILAANQLNRKLSHVIKPYTLGDTALLLNNRPVRRTAVGMSIERNHTCLSPNTLLITDEQLKTVRRERDSNRKAKLLNDTLQANLQNSPLRGQLILRSFSDEEQNQVITLNVATKDVTQILPLSKQIEMNGRSYPACLISSLL
jgi:hypothetical protein